MFVCVYVYIYIYIERERDIHLSLSIYIYICVYIYIYIYFFRGGGLLGEVHDVVAEDQDPVRRQGQVRHLEVWPRTNNSTTTTNDP